MIMAKESIMQDPLITAARAPLCGKPVRGSTPIARDKAGYRDHNASRGDVPCPIMTSGFVEVSTATILNVVLSNEWQ